MNIKTIRVHTARLASSSCRYIKCDHKCLINYLLIKLINLEGKRKKTQCTNNRNNTVILSRSIRQMVHGTCVNGLTMHSIPHTVKVSIFLRLCRPCIYSVTHNIHDNYCENLQVYQKQATSMHTAQ